MVKRGVICMAICLLFCLSIAYAETIPQIDFNVEAYSYEQLQAIQQLVDAKMLDMERQYAIENGNRAIVFEETEYTIFLKKSQTLTPTITRIVDDAPTRTTLLWTSTDSDIVKVSSEGIITGMAAGNTSITATAKDDEYIFASITVNVVLPVTRVLLSVEDVTLLVGASPTDKKVTLSSAIEPADAYCQTVTWVSSNPDVASVDTNGNIIALKAGKTTITATSDDPSAKGESIKKATCRVTVLQAVTGIVLDNDSLVIQKGSQKKLTATAAPEDASLEKFTWTSSNEDIATVSESGVVNGVAVGECDITCTASDGSKVAAVSNVVVKQLVTKVELSDKTISLSVGGTEYVFADVLPTDATDQRIIWESSDISIATVTDDGEIKGIAKGECVVTCKAQDGSEKEASVKVYVESKYPLEMTGIKVGSNSIGVPLVYVSVKNTSKAKTFVAFTFSTKCYDAFGNLLKAHGFGDTEQSWIWQEGSIKPGTSWSSGNWRWTLNGFSTAYRIEVWMTYLQTSDSETIRIPSSEQQVFVWEKN